MLRVAELTIDLAFQYCLPYEAFEILGNAALLHDFGKKRIEHSLLSKNGPLTPEEYQKIRQHVRLGFIAISSEKFVDARRVFIAHHEFKTDSYPRSGTERRKTIRFPAKNRRKQDDGGIMQLAQILAAADIFDALIFRRSYKGQFDRFKVQDIMERDFTGNRLLVHQLLERYPVQVSLTFNLPDLKSSAG